MRGVERRRVRVRRRQHDHIGRVERADHAPVVRLRAADARREVVGDEQRAGQGKRRDDGRHRFSPSAAYSDISSAGNIRGARSTQLYTKPLARGLIRRGRRTLAACSTLQVPSNQLPEKRCGGECGSHTHLRGFRVRADPSDRPPALCMLQPSRSEGERHAAALRGVAQRPQASVVRRPQAASRSGLRRASCGSLRRAPARPSRRPRAPAARECGGPPKPPEPRR